MSQMIVNGRRALTIALLGFLAVGAQFVGSSHVFASAYLTLNNFSGTPGSSLTVSGGGWTAGDTVAIYVNGTSGTPAATVTIATDSTFSTSVVVPANAPQGPLTITGVDQSNSGQATNSFYVVPLAPSISYTAASHAPHAVVTISGTGFAPNEGITLSLAGATASTTANATGAFSGTISVPQVASGLYNPKAVGNASGASAIEYFWIDTFYPSVSPSEYYVAPNGTLSFTGSGFAPGEMITVSQAGASSTLATFAVDQAGGFKNAGAFKVPASNQGKTAHFTLTGTTSGVSASADVTIGSFYAYASPTSYYLLPGQSETFTGGGFAAGETVDVFVGASTTQATTVVTDQTGSFMAAGSVLVPFGSTKSVSFRLVGETSGAQAGATIAVGTYFPSLSPSSYYVTPNTSITISGTGFAPNESVTLSNGSASTTQVTTTAMGTFSAPVLIPFGKGAATVTATGSMSGASTSVGVALAKFFPGLAPSSWYALPGQTITYSGAGFVPGETVTVQQGTVSSTVIADSFGTFTTASTTVPFTGKATLTATFTGELSQSPTAVTIAVGTLSPYLVADAYSAGQGSTVNVQGYSFGAGETVQVTAAGFSTTTVADANGTTPLVAVPTPYMLSSLPVTFKGMSSNVSAKLYVSLVSYNALISASTYYAQPGSSITITGTGFAPSETVNVVGGTSTSTVSTSAKGAFSTQVMIPFGSTSTKIVATGATSGAASSLTVGAASFNALVSPSSYYTLPGSTVTFLGSGFSANEVVDVVFNGTKVGTTNATAAGSFTYGYMIPYATTKAAFTFTGETSGASAGTSISLAAYSAYIALSTYYAQGGAPLTVTGSGFASGEQVALSWAGTQFATTNATAMGTISYTGTVPFSTAGTKTVTAAGSTSGVIANTNTTVAPVYTGIALDSYAGAPGSSVAFSGFGYLPNEPVTVTTDRSTAPYTFNADATGAFRNTGFVVPASFTGGPLVFTITGTHSFSVKTITYYVTGA